MLLSSEARGQSNTDRQYSLHGCPQEHNYVISKGEGKEKQAFLLHAIQSSEWLQKPHFIDEETKTQDTTLGQVHPAGYWDSGPGLSDCTGCFHCAGPPQSGHQQHQSCLRTGRNSDSQGHPRPAESATLGQGPTIHVLSSRPMGF